MLKRMVNLTVSLFVFAIDRSSSAIKWCLGKPRRRAIVLAYHAVLPEERSRFGHQMDVLKRHTTPIRADVESLPERNGLYAAVTFDDGLESVVENALPELAKRSIPTTLFIVTEVLGGYPRWEYMGGVDPSKERAMTEQQLQKLDLDLVTIGSHTMTHPLLTAVDGEQLRRELVGSRMKLEKMVNRAVKLLSFPYGDFNEHVVEKCRESSYERVFSALPVFAFSESAEFLTGRVGVTPTDSQVEFRLKLEGAYRWLPYAYALKRRLLSVLRPLGKRQVGLKPGEKAA